MNTERLIDRKIIVAVNLVAAGGDRGNQLIDNDPEIKQLVKAVKIVFQSQNKEKDN